ncbi:MAG TPA: peptide deformylase [Thermoguttaceae bacterium]|nr:peptide deformylase [Thermoguttaceae bacterium]
MNIVKFPHPALRRLSKPLVRVDAELRRMIAEMFELMYEHDGVGLAANQVDLPYRFFVANLQSDPAAKDQELVFINPIITHSTGSAEADEGCLSFPGIWAPVRRPEKVSLAAYDLSGQEIKLELDGLLARAVQHEIDHLDGVVFVDRLSPTNKLAVRDALDALVHEFAADQSRGLIPPDDQITARLDDLERLRT